MKPTPNTCAHCTHASHPIPTDWTTVDFFDRRVVAQEAVFRISCTVVPDAEKPCLKPATAATAQATTEKLRFAISDMDCQAQGGLSSIAAIAWLTLAALENPRTCNDLDSIADALESILAKALDTENCINATAEEVGCHYVDEAQRRRRAARQVAHESGKDLSHGL